VSPGKNMLKKRAQDRVITKAYGIKGANKYYYILPRSNISPKNQRFINY
jgi:hypothetical protein